MWKRRSGCSVKVFALEWKVTGDVRWDLDRNQLTLIKGLPWIHSSLGHRRSPLWSWVSPLFLRALHRSLSRMSSCRTTCGVSRGSRPSIAVLRRWLWSGQHLVYGHISACQNVAYVEQTKRIECRSAVETRWVTFIDAERVRDIFPELRDGTNSAVNDISIANRFCVYNETLEHDLNIESLSVLTASQGL